MISEAAATCFAEQLSHSRVGSMTLDEESLNLMLNTTEKIKMDTTSLARHLPLLEEKVGENIPLAFEISYDNINIEFGNEFDTDVLAEFTLIFRVMYDTTHPSNKELKLNHTEIYIDELRMVAGFDV